MKKINQKDWARSQKLNEHLCGLLQEPTRQSELIWRGDMRAIQWATWWIRETLKERQEPVK